LAIWSKDTGQAAKRTMSWEAN